jgi:hypothetical protein
MRMTPQLQLFGTYMQVRNALAAGTDPAGEQAIGPEPEQGINAVAFFRAGLRITFDTEDEVAAFDRFAQQLNDQAVALRQSSEALARQEEELHMVRGYLVQNSPGSTDLPPPPP